MTHAGTPRALQMRSHAWHPAQLHDSTRRSQQHVCSLDARPYFTQALRGPAPFMSVLTPRHGSTWDLMSFWHSMRVPPDCTRSSTMTTCRPWGEPSFNLTMRLSPSRTLVQMTCPCHQLRVVNSHCS